MSRALSRQLDGVLRQIDEQNQLVTRALALLGEIAASIDNEFDSKVVQQLDDLQVRLGEEARDVRRGELGVRVRGVEPDARLVEAARGRGLDVEPGFAIDYLRRLEAGSLGGIVMIQVIEHLSPQHVIDVVELAAEKLRPGGKFVLETVNPASLYTYAHALWVDPDHVRPVHPGFLEFLFREAEFSRLAIEYRSPVSDDERLVPLPGDDAQTALLNRNFERIGALLFGAQDYAVIATR
jgi:O-antigen chain-terminating methyltransferase